MKNRLLNWLLYKTINAVVIKDVIDTKGGVLRIGGRVPEKTELQTLQAEAKAMEGFQLWKIMNETIRAEAIDKGWNKSLNYDDLKTGKMMIYSLDVMESIIKVIKNKKIP